MKTVRIIAFLTGFLTLAWQVLQIVKGNGMNIFLIPDIILGIVLMITSFLKPIGSNVNWFIAALAYSCGVFATATFGGLLMNTYNFGAFTTTLGLVPCLFSIIWIIRKNKIV